MRLEEFVPERATAEQWRRFHAFRRQRHLEHRPDEPLEPDELAEKELRFPDSFNYNRRFTATLDDRVVSVLRTNAVRPESPEYPSSRHLAWGHAWVLRDHRRRGVGRGWIPTVVDVMDEYGATVLSTSAEEEDDHAFLRWLGAEPKMKQAESRLDLRTVDWEMVERWVREGQAASPDARLELYADRVPEEALDDFCTAFTRMINTVPAEELDHGDSHFTPERIREWYEQLDQIGGFHHVYVSREPDGSISGETDVLKLRHEPTHVHQFLTAVDPAARGRGLGKWLKAAMLLHVRATHPETIYWETENAGSNAPMLAINQRLGFRRLREVTYYQISRAALAARSG